GGGGGGGSSSRRRASSSLRRGVASSRGAGSAGRSCPNAAPARPTAITNKPILTLFFLMINLPSTKTAPHLNHIPLLPLFPPVQSAPLCLRASVTLCQILRSPFSTTTTSHSSAPATEPLTDRSYPRANHQTSDSDS